MHLFPLLPAPVLPHLQSVVVFAALAYANMNREMEKLKGRSIELLKIMSINCSIAIQ